MGKLAFVFPGQGTQYPGMGKSVYESFAASRKVYEVGDKLRPGTSLQCFEATAEVLRDTANTQPCIYITELAIAAALTDCGIYPEAIAGYSLGELAALTFAGVFTLEKGFPLVCRRGEIMAKAAAENPGAMVAVRGLSVEDVNEICNGIGDWYQVNYNCHGQSTCAGVAEKQTLFMDAVVSKGGKATPLAVSAAFHSKYMQAATDAFLPIIKLTGMEIPKIPVYANLHGRPYGEDMEACLANQIASPVLWQASIEAMIADGIDTFVEIGMGKGLSSFIQKICPEAKVFACETAEEVSAVVLALK